MDTEGLFSLLNLLNNRQIALVIWLGLFSLWVLWRRDTRSSLGAVASALFEPIVLFIFLLMAIYTSLWLRFFQQIQLWNITFIADTVLWFFGTGCLLLLNITKVERDKFYFRNIIRETFALIVITEFLVNFHSFSLLAEFLLVPVLFVIIGVRIVADSDDKYYAVKKLFDFVLAAFSVALFFLTVQNLLADLTEFANVNTLRSFIVFPLLTLAYVPFLYLVALFFAYEASFRFINVILKLDREFSRYLKWKTLWLCHFNLRRLHRLKLVIFRSITKQTDAEGFHKLLHEYEVEAKNDWRFVWRWFVRIAIVVITAFVLSMAI